MLHGFIRDPHFFTSAILPANILLSYVNTKKSLAHSFRSSPFCFLPPDSSLCSQSPCTSAQSHSPHSTQSVHITNKKLLKVNLLPLSLLLISLDLALSCMQLLSGLYGTLDSIKLNSSVTSTIFLSTYKIRPLPAPLWNLFWYSDIIQHSFVY